jgi:Iron-sulfur cluster binding domain of dihydroorotate dehydrogenase B
MISRAASNSDFSIGPVPRPDLRAAPGQFYLAIPPTFDPYLPRPIFPFRLRGEFVESFILPRQVAAWRIEGLEKLRGPYGKSFELPPRSRRALVLAHDVSAGAQLLALIDALVTRDCEVAALCVPNEWMERWLPPEVEYRAVDDVPAAAGELWNWADAVYACGSMTCYDQLYRAARRTRLTLERGWAQILLRDLPMPCGTGLCYACALKTARGVMLNCQDGPVFDLADWILEE